MFEEKLAEGIRLMNSRLGVRGKLKRVTAGYQPVIDGIQYSRTAATLHVIFYAFLVPDRRFWEAKEGQVLGGGKE